MPNRSPRLACTRFVLSCVFFCALLTGALLSGCTTVRFMEDAARYDDEVERHEAALALDPDDLDALRRLGVIYTRTSRHAKAGPLLERAHALDPDDPQTLFYLGISYEASGRTEEARTLYARYAEVPRLSPFRQPMANRYVHLVRKQARDEMRARLAVETDLADEPLQTDVVAVMPLTYLGDDDRYAPLGRGLAEMITIDLSNVQALRPVERVRLQALLDEIALAEAGAVDSLTAPRAGRLLGAGRVLGGSYTVLPDDQLRVDAALTEVGGGVLPKMERRVGGLEDFFRLEKELVFRLLEAMQITLSPEERTRIEQIPTENLQAFLAYSRGLEAEDAGRFEAAQSFYGEAASLDPGFTAAGAASETVGEVSEEAVSASAEDILDELPEAEPAAGEEGEVDLVDDRLRTLAGSAASGFVPGEDSRRAAAEGSGELSAPPPPPGTTSSGLPQPPTPPSGGN